MADTTTELEVLDEIVDVLGGTPHQHKTVVPVLEDIRDLLGGGGGGYNPALSVGRADALTGADSTAQWAQRTTEGSGAATVRSVQGAAEVIDGELVPVHIAGIQSKDALGGELDGVEWSTQTLRAAGSVADMLYADHVDVRVGVVDLGTLTWGAATAEGRVETSGAFVNDVRTEGKTNISMPDLSSDTEYTVLPYYTGSNDAFRTDKSISIEYNNGKRLFIYDSSLANMTAAQVKAALSGKTLYYELATPTTTPISPALPMSYKVQQGGSESIIVPDGEVSAAPIITVAEGESAGELVMDALACIAAPDGPVATANHALNTYLTMGSKLYKVTSAIAVGETITAGTNVSETTVMAELIARTA